MAVFAVVWLYSLVLAGSQVRRFSWSQQREVAAWVQARAGALGRAPRVAAPALIYFRLREAFAAVGLATADARDGHWLDGAPDAFVLPEWYATSIRRDRANPAAVAELERLESGAAGYRVAARWHSSYLQEGFYTRLDPAFAADFWQGEIGFTVWVPLRSIRPES